MDVASIAEIGELLLSTKWFAISMYAMWTYDYFLTLGDEYAWSGRKSWIFALFVTNRYLPILHIVYKCLIMFGFTEPFCKATRWEVLLYTTLVIVLAQMTVALRVHAVTGRRKPLGLVLCVLIAAQLGAGICVTVWDGHHGQHLPEVNLDAFKLCLAQRWRTGEVTLISITMAFDILAFLSILIAARESGTAKYPGVPSILGVILRDATFYFLVMFANQIVLFLFLFLAPAPLQLTPGITQVMLLPVLASRLMLSLKKAAAEPAGLWSLSTMGGLDLPWGTADFSEPSTLPSEDMELARLSRDISQQPC